MNIKEQQEDFKALTHDINRWAWVIEVNRSQVNQGKKRTLTVILDNDKTYLRIGDNTDDDVGCFTNSIGDMNGVIALLDALDIDCEMV